MKVKTREGKAKEKEGKGKLKGRKIRVVSDILAQGRSKVL